VSAARTPIQPASEPPPPLMPREFRLRIDPLLALAAIGLLACSLVAIKGATADDIDGQPLYYVMRQGVYGGIGVLFMLAMSRLDYSRRRELKYAVYGLLIGSIVLVSVFGTNVRGSKAWIDLPFFRLQPSELGKVLLVLSISAFMVDRMRRPGRQTTARVMLLVLVPTMLVMAQDLGSSLVFVVGGLALLFVAGAPWRHFAALGALGLVAIALVVAVLPTAGVDVLKPYQQDRLTSFLHPNDVLGREGYQQRQSIIAIGSGEKTGRGAEKADQTGLGFLPEHHTDFIFAVIGETYGFVGAALVLSLYALLIWRGLRILTLAKNLYGALIAGGITLMLLFQTFVNVGMNVGIMPITGVPAPLLSYGGSSLLATFLAIGLLQSIHAQAREVATAKSLGGQLS
jgi:rod shape determining protein RodA